MRNSFKVKIRRKDPSMIKKVFWDTIAKAISEYVQIIYPAVLNYVPVDQYPDARRKKGLIARNLKLMNTTLNGRRYLSFGISGTTEEAERAKQAIMSLHYGWNSPHTTQGKFMTFPVKRVMKAGSLTSPPPGKTGWWVGTTKISRTGRYKKDPWIWRIVESTLPLLEEILDSKLNRNNKKIQNKKVR